MADLTTRLGFSSTAQFDRAFSSRFGCSASELGQAVHPSSPGAGATGRAGEKPAHDITLDWLKLNR